MCVCLYTYTQIITVIRKKKWDLFNYNFKSASMGMYPEEV